MKKHPKFLFLTVLVPTIIITFFYTLLSLQQTPPKHQNESFNRHSDAQSGGRIGENEKQKNSSFENLSDIAIKFLTDVKVTDILLALFTYLLYAKTSGLDDSTRKLWQSANEAERPWITFEVFDFGALGNSTIKASPPRYLNDREVINGLRIEPNWINTGKRPGLVEVLREYKLVKFDEKKTTIESLKYQKSEGRRFLLGPGRSGKGNFIGLDDFEHQALLSRIVKVEVYSIARYRIDSTQKDFFYTEIAGFCYFSGYKTNVTTGQTLPEWIFAAVGSHDFR